MVRVGIDLFYKVLYETKIVVGDDYDGNSRHSTAEKKKTSKKKRVKLLLEPVTTYEMGR